MPPVAQSLVTDADQVLAPPPGLQQVQQVFPFSLSSRRPAPLLQQDVGGKTLVLVAALARNVSAIPQLGVSVIQQRVFNKLFKMGSVYRLS